MDYKKEWINQTIKKKGKTGKNKMIFELLFACKHFISDFSSHTAKKKKGKERKKEREKGKTRIESQHFLFIVVHIEIYLLRN